MKLISSVVCYELKVFPDCLDSLNGTLYSLLLSSWKSIFMQGRREFCIFKVKCSLLFKSQHNFFFHEFNCDVIWCLELVGTYCWITGKSEQLSQVTTISLKFWSGCNCILLFTLIFVKAGMDNSWNDLVAFLSIIGDT